MNISQQVNDMANMNIASVIDGIDQYLMPYSHEVLPMHSILSGNREVMIAKLIELRKADHQETVSVNLRRAENGLPAWYWVIADHIEGLLAPLFIVAELTAWMRILN